MTKLRTSELAKAVGVSQSYASEIISGKRRPSRSLAIRIFRRLGWKHPSISDLTAKQIDVFESVEPWAPREKARPSDDTALGSQAGTATEGRGGVSGDCAAPGVSMNGGA